MRAVVLETKDSLATVLADDGRVHNIQGRGYHIGQQIEMGSDTQLTHWAAWLSRHLPRIMRKPSAFQ